MVTERAAGRYTFHDLLRAYATELAEQTDTAEVRRDAAHRVLDQSLRTAMAAARAFTPALTAPRLPATLDGVVPAEIAGRDQAAAWFDTEAAVVLTLTRYAADNEFDTYAWLLPWTMTTYFNRRGRWRETEQAQRIAVAAARRAQDKLGLAHAHTELGNALNSLGERAEAEANLQQALVLFRELGRVADEAWVLSGLALLYEAQHRYAEALAISKDALRMLQAVGHWWTQGMVENGVGWLHAHLGQHDKALVHCERALRLLREAGRRGPEADTLDSLGFIHRLDGDLATSRSYYEQALATYREIGDAYGQTQSLGGLAETLLADGDRAGARDAWRRALAGLDRLQHPSADLIRARLAELDAEDGQDEASVNGAVAAGG
jgi:tetratricopeptide (TPR) repeat protein